MESLYNINKQIYELRQQQQYRQALALYKEKVDKKYPVEEIREVDHLIANVLFCLRKTKQYLPAIDFVNTYLYFKPLGVTHPNTCSELGWNWYFYVKTLPVNQLINQVPVRVKKAITFWKEIDGETNYLLYFMLLSELSRKLMQKGNAVVLLCQLLDEVNPDLLEKDPTTVSNSSTTQKPFEKASHLEFYLVQKAKAQLLAGQFVQCMATCSEAFAKISRFHNGNHVWLARNMAFSLMQTGKLSEAIAEMEKIITKKNDWFLWHELAQMYRQSTAHAKLAGFAICKAYTEQGHTPYKAGLYQSMASNWNHLFDVYWQRLLVLLSIATRQGQNWNQPPALAQLAADLQCPTFTATEAVLYKEIKTHCLMLMDKLNDAKHLALSVYNGTITRILNPGENGDGFITTDKGLSVYFRSKKVKSPLYLVDEGARVEVKVNESTYKGRKGLVASWIRIKK